MDNNTFGSGTFNVNTTAAFAGQRNVDGSLAGVPTTASFTVNANGAFFKAKNPYGNNYSAGIQNYNGGTLRAQVAILIHELAHLLTIEGFKSDFGDEQAGKDNDKMVDKNCGKLIKGLK